jgi:hypothetical protein
MSILTEISRLQTAKSDIASAITAKGGTVNSGDGFSDFAAAIGTITGAGGASLPSSITAIDGGSFTPASDTACSAQSFSHNLGYKPHFASVAANPPDVTPHATYLYLISCASIAGELYNGNDRFLYTRRNTNGALYSGATDSGLTLSNTSFADTQAYYYKSGVTYDWYTLLLTNADYV